MSNTSLLPSVTLFRQQFGLTWWLLGHSWNRARSAWQNPCGVFRPRANTHDPRQTYGEEPVTA